MLIKFYLVAHLDFGLEVPMFWSGGCSKHTFRLGSYFPFLAYPSRLPHMWWRAYGKLTYRVSSSWWQTQARSHINLLELWEIHLAHNRLATLVHYLTAPYGYKVPKNQSGTQSPSICGIAISLLAWYERRQIRLGEWNTCFWCDHAYYGCSFSFRERSAVKSACGVLPVMSPQPRGVGPSSTGPESSRQLVVSSRNFYVRHTFLGRRTSM